MTLHYCCVWSLTEKMDFHFHVRLKPMFYNYGTPLHYVSMIKYKTIGPVSSEKVNPIFYIKL